MANSSPDPQSTLFSVMSSLIRAGLSSAPYGGGIASLWSDWDTSRRFDRVNHAIKELGEELIKHNSFDPAHLGDAEMQLLEDMLQRISREHREAKRRRHVQVLTSNWLHSERPFDERLLFQRASDEFEDIHIRLLEAIGETLKPGKLAIPSEVLCATVFGQNADEQTKFSIFVPALNKLAAEYGFVRRRAIPTGRVMTDVNPEGLVFHLNSVLSPLGQRFLDSLRGDTPV